MILSASANYQRPLIFAITGLKPFAGKINDLIEGTNLIPFESLNHLLTHPSGKGYHVDPISQDLFIRYGNEGGMPDGKEYHNPCGVKLHLTDIFDI